MTLPLEVMLPAASNRARALDSHTEKKCDALEFNEMPESERDATYHVYVRRITPVSITQLINAMHEQKDNLTWDSLITTMLSAYHSNKTQGDVK
jgi:hypothetical protein